MDKTDGKKISINVLGCCVSRDTVAHDCFDVGRYLGFISPYTMLSGTPYYVSVDEVKNTGLAGTFARAMHYDAANQAIKYISEVQSDWLLLDICTARRPVLKWNDSGLVITHNFDDKIIYARLKKLLGEPDEEVNALDIPLNIMQARMEQVCNEILAFYKPEQIILHKAYGVDDYLTKDGKIKKFQEKKLAENAKRHVLLERLNNVCESKFKGCHVIEMPDNVFADEMHRWGIQTLHYFGPYYDYVADAIKIIDNNNGVAEERSQIESLRKKYSEKFSEWRSMIASGNSQPLLELREECFKKIVPIKNESTKIIIDVFGSDTCADIIRRNENKYQMGNFANRSSVKEAMSGKSDLFGCDYSDWLLLDIVDINKYGITEKEMPVYIERLCDEILKVYPVKKIILNEHYNVDSYMASDSTFKAFDKSFLEKVEAENKIIKLANGVCEKKLNGCHIIKMPEHTFADENNQRGLSPLSYTSHYYSYISKCISVITSILPPVEENRRLEELFELYSERMLSNAMWARKNGYRSQREELRAKVRQLRDQQSKLEECNNQLKEEIACLMEQQHKPNGGLEELGKRNKVQVVDIGRFSDHKLESELNVQKYTFNEEDIKKEAAEAEIKNIRASLSYKIGRAVTYLPRKIRDVFKRH